MEMPTATGKLTGSPERGLFRIADLILRADGTQGKRGTVSIDDPDIAWALAGALGKWAHDEWERRSHKDESCPSAGH